MEKFKCFLVFADKNDSYIVDKLQEEFFGSFVFCTKLTDDSTLYTWSEMNQHPEFMNHIQPLFCIDDNYGFYFDPMGKAKEEGNQIVTEINYCINELPKLDIEFTDIIYTIDSSSESSIEKGIAEIKSISKKEVYIKKSDVLDILSHCINQLPEYIMEEESEDEYDRD